MGRPFVLMVTNRLASTYGLLLRCIADVTDDEGSRVLDGQLMPVVWHIGHVTLIDADYVVRAGGSCPLPPAYDALFQTGDRRERCLPVTR